MDRISSEKRSWNMRQIRSSDTGPEKLIRSVLFKAGFRFRKNVKTLPGKPDIVLPKYHTVVFVNGCFWHHHENCRFAYIPKSHTDFWLNKFKKNQLNDLKSQQILQDLGWKVITVWECSLKTDFDTTMDNLISEILNNFTDRGQS